MQRAQPCGAHLPKQHWIATSLALQNGTCTSLHGSHLLLDRCYAALGDVAKARYLRNVNETAHKEDTAVRRVQLVCFLHVIVVWPGC